MFLKNKNIIFKIRRSKVTDYAALILLPLCVGFCICSLFVIQYFVHCFCNYFGEEERSGPKVIKLFNAQLN